MSKSYCLYLQNTSRIPLLLSLPLLITLAKLSSFRNYCSSLLTAPPASALPLYSLFKILLPVSLLKCKSHHIPLTSQSPPVASHLTQKAKVIFHSCPARHSWSGSLVCFWPHLLWFPCLLIPFQLHWTLCCPQTLQIFSHLRISALAVSFLWNALLLVMSCF